MSCQKCEHLEIIFSKEVLQDWMLGWSKDGIITQENADYEEMIIFIDRGYLRFAQKDDCQCMDHGDKIKINFCPFCGEKLG